MTLIDIIFCISHRMDGFGDRMTYFERAESSSPPAKAQRIKGHRRALYILSNTKYTDFRVSFITVLIPRISVKCRK